MICMSDVFLHFILGRGRQAFTGLESWKILPLVSETACAFGWGIPLDLSLSGDGIMPQRRMRRRGHSVYIW